MAASGVSSGASHVTCSESDPPPCQGRGRRRFDRIHGASGRPARCGHCSDRQRRGLDRRPVVDSVQISVRRYLLIAGVLLLRAAASIRTLVLHRTRSRWCWFEKSKGLSGGCPHLAGRLSSPPFECMRECTHLVKTEQPRNLGYMQLAVTKVTNRQIAPQLLKYFGKVQPIVLKLSGQRSLAHSQTAGNVFHEHPPMRKKRRDRVLNSRAQLAHI